MMSAAAFSFEEASLCSSEAVAEPKSNSPNILVAIHATCCCLYSDVCSNPPGVNTKSNNDRLLQRFCLDTMGRVLTRRSGHGMSTMALVRSFFFCRGFFFSPDLGTGMRFLFSFVFFFFFV